MGTDLADIERAIDRLAAVIAAFGRAYVHGMGYPTNIAEYDRDIERILGPAPSMAHAGYGPNEDRSLGQVAADAGGFGEAR